MQQLSIVYNHRHREHPASHNTACAAPLPGSLLSLEEGYGWLRPVRQGITWRLDTSYESDRCPGS